jgi:hypothetical protein
VPGDLDHLAVRRDDPQGLVDLAGGQGGQQAVGLSFNRPTGLAALLWRCCGVSVGILIRADAACVMRSPLFLQSRR